MTTAETELTDDMGNNPLESVLETKSEASKIQSDIDHLLNQIQVIDESGLVNPDSVDVKYDRSTRLAKVTLYYEYYE